MLFINGEANDWFNNIDNDDNCLSINVSYQLRKIISFRNDLKTLQISIKIK